MNKISFIIPVYDVNIEDLNNCINSITSQKLLEYEILIINDGSKNKNIEKECKKISFNNSNIKYYYQNNSGSAVARNTGIENATGDYIMFVDADDMLVKGFINELYNIINKNSKNEIIVFDYSYWDLSNEEIQSLKTKENFTNKKEEILSNILYYPNKLNNFMFGSIWAKLFSKKFLNKNKISFEPELRKAQDRRFMMEVIYNSDKILYYPIYSYKYRTNNNSICHKLNYNMINYYKKLYDSLIKFKKDHELDDKIYKFLEYNIVNEILPLSIFHIENKKKYHEKKIEFNRLYEEYNLYYKTRKINFSEIPSIKGKFKLIFYRYKFIFLLYIFFIIKQRKIIKNAYK